MHATHGEGGRELHTFTCCGTATLVIGLSAQMTAQQAKAG